MLPKSILASTHYCSSDQSSCLGSNSHAKWTAPIKIFLEKHSSQSVDMLAKTHPYNPLWAQLGDLYGAIGSPVRLARTVVVGKRQDMVQRLLYFLTYFIRCSELQETHLLENGEDEAIVMPGTVITTTLEKVKLKNLSMCLSQCTETKAVCSLKSQKKQGLLTVTVNIAVVHSLDKI